jgi:hypothetical protein
VIIDDVLAGDVVERLAVPGEVDDAGGDVHVHDPVHDLKTYKKYSVADSYLAGTGTLRAWLIRI